MEGKQFYKLNNVEYSNNSVLSFIRFALLKSFLDKL